MLSEEQIRQGLPACRVVPLVAANPHGLFGSEQLAAAVARLNPAFGPDNAHVYRPIVLDQTTWEKLDQSTETAAQATSCYITASQVAAAIIVQYVAALPEQHEEQE